MRLVHRTARTFMCRYEGSVQNIYISQKKSVCQFFAEWARLLPHLASGMVKEEAFGCEKVPVTVFQDSDDLSRSVAHHIAALIAHKAEAGELECPQAACPVCNAGPAHSLSVLILRLDA